MKDASRLVVNTAFGACFALLILLRGCDARESLRYNACNEQRRVDYIEAEATAEKAFQQAGRDFVMRKISQSVLQSEKVKIYETQLKTVLKVGKEKC